MLAQIGVARSGLGPARRSVPAGDGPFVRHAHDNGERACTRPRAHEADAHIAHDNGGEPGPDPGRVSRRPGAASHAHRSAWTTLLLESVRERSEEHTSELQSLMRISYAVFCLKKKKR